MNETSISYSEMKTILDNEIKKIFEGKDINQLSDFEKRSAIYSYFVENNDYDFERLNVLLNINRMPTKEDILAALERESGDNQDGQNTDKKRGKAVCHGIAYAYKLMLEQLNIKSILIASRIKCDDIDFLQKEGVGTQKVPCENGKYFLGHMFVLVKNSDGTYSFDDPTSEILHRDEGISYMNFNSLGCKYRNLVDIEGYPSDILAYFVDGYRIDDEERKFEKSKDGLIILPDNIQCFNPKDVEEQDFGSQNANR